MPLPRAWPRRRRSGGTSGAARRHVRHSTAARQEEALHPAMAILRRFDARHAARQIDDQLVATQHVLALRHDDVAGERDRIARHIEDTEFTGGDLLLLRDDDVAAGLELLDFLIAAGAGLGLLHGLAALRRRRRRGLGV